MEIRIAPDPDRQTVAGSGAAASLPGVIVGTGFSSRALIASFLRYGSFPTYRLFAPPHRLDVVRTSVERVVEASAGREICVHDLRSMLHGFDALGVTSWYDPFADLWRCAYVRSNFSDRVFPITGTIHTISYQSLLRRYYPSILLSQTYPCDSIVCISAPAARAFRQLLDHVAERFSEEYGLRMSYNGRLDVIPLGVDTEVFRPRDKQAARKALDLPADVCIVLCVGRLSVSDKMDLFPLLRVFRDCRGPAGGPAPLLVIAGSERAGNAAALTAEIRDLGLCDRVRLTEAPASTAWLYSAADIFVSPSDNVQESFGNTIAEALASGVPAVVSDWDGYRDIVDHGVTGFRVPTYWGRSDDDLALLSPLTFDDGMFDHCCMAQSVSFDLDEYRRYLQLLIDEPDLREEMGKRSRERAERVYAWPAVVRQYERLWEELERDAQKIVRPAKPLRGLYAQPRYFDAFSGYATFPLAGEDTIRITEAGRQALRRGRVAPVASIAAQMGAVDAPQLDAALAGLARMCDDAPAVAFGSLIERVGVETRQHRDVVSRHIQWLLKYGYARVASKHP